MKPLLSLLLAVLLIFMSAQTASANQNNSEGKAAVTNATNTIAGIVFNDLNANGIIDDEENTTNTGSIHFYAYLVESGSQKIVGISPVSRKGLFEFSEAAAGKSYKIVLVETQSPLKINDKWNGKTVLPLGYTATKDYNGKGFDGTANATVQIEKLNSDVNNILFGIHSPMETAAAH